MKKLVLVMLLVMLLVIDVMDAYKSLNWIGRN